MRNNKNRLVKVFAGSLWQAEVIKGMLESNNVPCAVLNETIGAVTSPYSPTAGEAVVVVDENYKKHAIDIIESNNNQ